MVDYTYNATVLQGSSVTYDPNRILRPLEEVSIIDRLFPFLELPGLADLKYTYYTLSERSLPSVVHDLSSDGEADTITSQKKDISLPYIEDFMRYSDMQWERMQRDPANFDENLRELGEKFGEKRNIIGLGGNTDPAINGLLNTNRATDAALTNKTATTFAGWAAMIGELRSDLRGAIKNRFNTINKWLLMTDDVYTLAETTYSTTKEELSVLDWLNQQFNGEVYVDDHFGETTPGANDGTQNIMIGVRDPSFAQILQTGIHNKDISRHSGEKRFRFAQHFVPVTYKVGGYHYEDAVTIV